MKLQEGGLTFRHRATKICMGYSNCKNVMLTVTLKTEVHKHF